MWTLHAIGYSPWSERARWALDHHGVRYREREFVPMLSEPLIRAQTGTWRGRISAPLLVDAHALIVDSSAIASHTERIGSGTPLFPDELRAAIDHWDRLSDRLACRGRERVAAASLHDRDAKIEAIPFPVPRLAKLALLPVADAAIRHLERKYALALADEAGALADIRAVLGELREQLGDGARRAAPLLGVFTFADVAMAAALAAVEPVGGWAHTPAAQMGPATRRVWTQPALAAEFRDLLHWRDGIYAAHRRSSSLPATSASSPATAHR
jgi:glutathione S-transferase